MGAIERVLRHPTGYGYGREAGFIIIHFANMSLYAPFSACRSLMEYLLEGHCQEQCFPPICSL